MAASAQPLRIASASGPAELCLQELTKRVGFMREFGVEPSYIRAPDGQKALANLLEGRADYCTQIGFGPALAAIANGEKLKILAGANLRAVHAIFSPVPEIRRVRDLEGARVGIGSRGALTHQMMTAACLAGGADPAKVEFVSIGNSHDVFKAVVAREIDAGLGEVDFINQQEELGFHALEDGKLWELLPDFTNQGAYTSQAMIDSKREVIVGALAASAKLYRYLCSPESWDDFLAARQAAVSPDVDEAKSQWGFYQEWKPFAFDLVLSESRLQYMQELNVAMGLQARVLPFDQVADMSLAKDALKLLDG